MVSCDVITCGVSSPNEPIELGVNTSRYVAEHCRGEVSAPSMCGDSAAPGQFGSLDVTDDIYRDYGQDNGGQSQPSEGVDVH